MAGVLLQALPLMGGGLAQGGALAQADIPFMQTLRPGLMGLRLSTLGAVLMPDDHMFLLGYVGISGMSLSFGDSTIAPPELFWVLTCSSRFIMTDDLHPTTASSRMAPLAM